MVATSAASVVWFPIVHLALFYHFNGGPSAFVQFLELGENLYRIHSSLVFVVVPLTPVLFGGLLFLFGLKPKAKQMGLAIAIYLLACPVSICILAVLNHPGGADAVHTIKSGVIIPFLIVGLGVLVPNREEIEQPHGSTNGVPQR